MNSHRQVLFSLQTHLVFLQFERLGRSDKNVSFGKMLLLKQVVNTGLNILEINTVSCISFKFLLDCQQRKVTLLDVPQKIK